PNGPSSNGGAPKPGSTTDNKNNATTNQQKQQGKLSATGVDIQTVAGLCLSILLMAGIAYGIKFRRRD
ncbi:hypothetical protein, partial [Bifidobacterium catulorum]